MISIMGHMVLPSVSRRTIIRILPTIVLAIISLIALSLLEFATIQPIDASQQQHSAMATAAALKFITVPPRAPHTATIIFSHGLGDTGDGWRPVATMLASQFPYVKWILPHAPVMPITINGGIEMPGWFDLYSLGKSDDKEDEEGLLRSSKLIHNLVAAENEAGIPSERTTRPNSHGHSHLLGHGTADPVVPYKFGQMSVEHMKGNLGFSKLQFNSYKGMAHSAEQQEIADLGAWLKSVIPPL
ncbi:phospholipase Carboxylesterase [Rhizoctonia solani]|uniref:Acyl-protein thioesterase 1 n=1 Tax=Rhizoctonia solani TaxID=456999 RepID=A0A8H7M8D2_9AGAM|nr:phospholipase Carboxylesterase [Rhizoctonia solani]